MKKIVITGANGFIGSSLAKKLMAKNFDVICLVREGADTTLLPQYANIIFVNYSDSKLLRKIFSKNEILIHTAAMTKAKNWQQIYKANVELTQNLIEYFNQTKSMKQLIFLSSQAVSGPAINKTSPKKESDENNPLTIYGKSKLEAEKIIFQNCKNWTILRPVSVFGPGDKDFLQLFKLIKKNISIQIGRKNKFFNLIYINDLVEIIIRCIDNKKTFNEIIFATNSKIISQIEFSQMFSKSLNKKILKLTIPIYILKMIAKFNELFFKAKTPLLNKEKIKELEQQYWLVEGKKAEKLLAYKSADNFLKQVKKTYDWYLKKGWL